MKKSNDLLSSNLFDMLLFLLLKDGFARGCLTVCVTCAGAGDGTPSDWEKAEA